MLRRRDGTVMAETAVMAFAFAALTLLSVMHMGETPAAAHALDTGRSAAIPVILAD